MNVPQAPRLFSPDPAPTLNDSFAALQMECLPSSHSWPRPPPRPASIPHLAKVRQPSKPGNRRSPLRLLTAACHPLPPQLSPAASHRPCAARPFSTSPSATVTCALPNEPRVDSSRNPSFSSPVATLTLLRCSRLVCVGCIRLSQRPSAHSHIPAWSPRPPPPPPQTPPPSGCCTGSAR